jgi:hypothetical protein
MFHRNASLHLKSSSNRAILALRFSALLKFAVLICATCKFTQARKEASMVLSETFEPFVDADAVAQFLSMTRRDVLRLTRQGRITGYPCSGRKRITYKYRLSVVAEDITNLKKPARGIIAAGSPRSSVAMEQKNGTE